MGLTLYHAISTFNNPGKEDFWNHCEKEENAGNQQFLHFSQGVLCGSVVKCLTRNPGVLGSSRTDPLGFFVEMSLGKTLQSPSLTLVKPRKDMNDMNCCRDMTEILLKAA